MRAEEAGRSPDYAIKIIREPLHLCRCFAAAFRAAGKIRVARADAIEGVYNILGVFGRLMHGVDAPVQYLIGVEQEARDVTRGSVVRACSRIALAESNRHP